MPVIFDARWVRLAALIVGGLMSLPVQGLGLALVGGKLLLAAAFLTYGLMPFVIRLANRIGAVDYPDARRIHREPTPRIGGLAVFLSVNVTLFLNFNYSVELKAICISGALIALISFWDDVKGLRASVRLLAQLMALVIVLASGVVLEFDNHDGIVALWGNGIGLRIDLMLEYLFTALWIIGVTNAFNFLDGINGLAAALAASICAVMAMLAGMTSQTFMLLLCVAVAGAALGFLPDNARYSRPARTFLGDTGSTYLGWMMACIAVLGGWSDKGALQSHAAPLLIFAVPIFDMIYTTVARIGRGDVRSTRQWISFVGQDHIHHRLMFLGLSQSDCVLAIVAITLISGLAALVIVGANSLETWLLLGQSVVLYAVLSFIMILAARRVRRGE